MRRRLVSRLLTSAAIGLQSACLVLKGGEGDTASASARAPETGAALDSASTARVSAAGRLAPRTGIAVTDADLRYLRARRLLIPVPGVPASALTDNFDEVRAGGARRHEAMDILAPRGTPVLSTDDGRIARVDTSAGGGLSVYAADPSGRFVYYYAHLDHYRAGLRDSQPLARGDTIGYVGTTGNAPANTPHLHFAISLLGDPRRWWHGVAINPYPILSGRP